MSITSVINDTVTSVSLVNAQKPLPPTISGYSVAGKDDVALDPAGGQTVQVNGTGFLPGATITFDGSAVSVVTYANANQLTFTSPAKSAGTYTIYVVNPDGGTAIYIPGIIYSTLPTWTTSAGTLGSYYETQSISNTVVASGDAPITYSLFSGSLPTGATLYSNGVISGSAPVDSSSTTYSFTIQASDAQLQDSTRSFSLTINTDVVTWVSPANATTYTSAVDSAISNVTLSATDAAGYGIVYTANSLPTGLSLSGNTISGTPTVVADSSTLLTATANTTSRSATRTINWSITVANDAYFEYNTLLIPGASTTFVDDASTNNFAVTINGDTKPNSFNPYSPGYYSNYFNGSTDFLTVPSGWAQLSTGNFTIEGWINIASNSTIQIIADTRGSVSVSPWQLYTSASGKLIFNLGSNLTGSTTISANTWTHVAVVRSSSTVTLYVNGVSDGSTTSSANLSGGATCYIGRTYDTSGTLYYSGYISNFRTVIGTAVYTTNFTPSTSPLTAISGTSLLTCQSNRFIDNSTNAFTITTSGTPQIKSFQPFTPNSNYSTYGSAYFDGTGDYLTTTGNTWTQLSTGNFTVEGWCYITSYGTYFALVDARGSGSLIAWLFGVNGSGYADFYGGSGMTRLTGSVAVGLNTWVHLATVRNGSTVTLYVNGVSAASTTYSSAINGTSATPSIGRLDDPYYATGYISNLRSVIGTAVYTASFTPPSQPLTAISGTSLLTLQNNQSVNNNIFLDNSSNNFLVTRAGNTTQGTFSPYGGNWSNYFGSADKLTLTGPNLGSLTNFTFECWVNFNAFGTDCKYFLGVSGSNYYQLVHDASTGISFRISSGYYKVVGETSNSGWSTGTWYHVALVKSGSNYTIYKNGNSIATGVWASALASVNLNYIGGYDSSTGINGYMSNASFSSNANWSGNFTPSTTPLTSGSNPAQLLLTCQSNRFIDASLNNYALTPSGSPTIQRFSPFNPASLTPISYSGYFGSTNGVSIYISGSDPGGVTLSGNYTIEMWLYPTGASSSGYSILACPNSYGGTFQFYYNSSGKLGYYTASAGAVLTSSAPITFNAWQHVALVRSSNVVKVYVNGVEQSFASAITDSTSVGVNFIGGIAAIYSTYGYISNVRVNNTAVYTTNFTPSTSPLTAISGTQLLILQSTTLIDNSTNNYTLYFYGTPQPSIQNPFGYTSALTNGYSVSTIGGSGYFDGTGDYLLTPSSTNLVIGTGNFAVEAWIYPTAYDNYNGYLSTISGQSTPQGISMSYDEGWLGSTTVNVTYAWASLLTLNAWNHIAITREGTTVRWFVNGILRNTATSSLNLTSSTAIIGGRYYNGTYLAKGYISDARIVSGSAVYTSSFVPPSQPLTAITNTALLTNMTSAGIYDAAMMNNLETVGDAKLSTAVSKFGGSSMYFDGTLDYINAKNTVLYDFGSGDFTIEAWVYISARGSSGSCFAGTWGASGRGWIWLCTSTTLSFVYSTNGTNETAGPAATYSVPLTTWTHLAAVRYGNTITMYANGTSVGSASVTGVTINPATQPLYIGANKQDVDSGINNYQMNGYIDDFRITKGYARYTTNFTAPTSAFPIY